MNSRSPSPERRAPAMAPSAELDNPFGLPAMREARGRHQGRDVWSLSGLSQLSNEGRAGLEASDSSESPEPQRRHRARRVRHRPPQRQERSDTASAARVVRRRTRPKTGRVAAAMPAQVWVTETIHQPAPVTQSSAMHVQMERVEAGAVSDDATACDRVYSQMPATRRKRPASQRPGGQGRELSPPVAPLGFGPMFYDPDAPQDTGTDHQRDTSDQSWLCSPASVLEAPASSAPVTVTELTTTLSGLSVAPAACKTNWFEIVAGFLGSGDYVPLNEQQRSQLSEQIGSYQQLIHNVSDMVLEMFTCSPLMTLALGDLVWVIELQFPEERLHILNAMQQLLTAFSENNEGAAKSWRQVISPWIKRARKYSNRKTAQRQVTHSVHAHLEPYVVMAILQGNLEMLDALPNRAETLAWCYIQLSQYQKQLPRKLIGTDEASLNVPINRRHLIFTNPGHSQNYQALAALVTVVDKLHKGQDATAEVEELAQKYSQFFTI